MKFIIIGLGHFGSSLATQLTKMGHDVMGVDQSMSKVENFKEAITHTICLNATDAVAVRNLPVQDSDAVIVAIGEDEGANILATALIKQLKAPRLISRAVSPLHNTVLEAMGVDEIVHPEEETATRWAWKLNTQGVLDSIPLSPEYHIVEAYVPKRYVGKSIGEIGLLAKYNVIALTTMKVTEERNKLGSLIKRNKVQGVAGAGTVLEDGDVLVLYGHIKNIHKLIR